MQPELIFTILAIAFLLSGAGILVGLLSATAAWLFIESAIDKVADLPPGWCGVRLGNYALVAAKVAC